MSNEATGKMVTVLVSVSERVTYSREVQMTADELKAWNERLDAGPRADFERAIEELASKFIDRRDDFDDAVGIRLEELSVVSEGGQ